METNVALGCELSKGLIEINILEQSLVGDFGRETSLDTSQDNLLRGAGVYG